MLRSLLLRVYKSLQNIKSEVGLYFSCYSKNPLEKERSRKKSSIYLFFSELSVPFVNSSGKVLKLPGFIKVFTILFIVSLLMSLIRTRDKKELIKEIKSQEIGSGDLDLISYFDLKNSSRVKMNKDYNLLCKNYKLFLTNFETDYRIHNLATMLEDHTTINALKLELDGAKVYYKSPTKLILVLDSTKLRQYS